MPETNHFQTLSYRPDIDGLRAIAVLMVVVFHAFPSILPGGFTGVDIFFVISGYLICSIIVKNLRAGEFTFAHFYSRRILRIFPALICMLGLCLVAGYIILLPDEYYTLGKHIWWGCLFGDNFVFWKEVGYFDGAALTKPLLNLWSLGIEEQFYLVFPLFLWILSRRSLSLLKGISLFAILSFICNMIFYFTSPTAAFYSPFSRMWELLAGAFLSLLPPLSLSL